MPALYKILASLLAVSLLSGCLTVVEVNTYPNVRSAPTPGFYNDTQKWQRARDYIGSEEYLSRADVVRGTGQYTAKIIQNRLVAQTGYRGWVCRQRFQYDVLVVRCARHDKLQQFVPYGNDIVAFHMQLQPLLRYGAAPVYIDWGW